MKTTVRSYRKQNILIIAALATLALLGVALWYYSRPDPAPVRVGIVNGVPAYAAAVEGFKEELAALDMKEGRDIVYSVIAVNESETASVDSALERSVNERVDLIYVIGHPIAVEAKKVTAGSGIPVVFSLGFLDAYPLVESAVRPEGNMTGFQSASLFHSPDRLRLLKRLAPQIRRVAILYDANAAQSETTLATMRPVFDELGLSLVELPMKSAWDVRAGLDQRAPLDDPGFDAIFIVPDALTQSPESWSAIRAFAEGERIPVAGLAAPQAESGALFSYNLFPKDIGALAARSARRILLGAPIEDIPVEMPPAYFRLNLRVAERLGIAVPEGIIREADEVIE